MRIKFKFYLEKKQKSSSHTTKHLTKRNKKLNNYNFS
jgi:hypothetical protein